MKRFFIAIIPAAVMAIIFMVYLSSHHTVADVGSITTTSVTAGDKSIVIDGYLSNGKKAFIKCDIKTEDSKLYFTVYESTFKTKESPENTFSYKLLVENHIDEVLARDKTGNIKSIWKR